MLRTILEGLGHQVVHAQNGARALELAKVCDFDLLIVEAHMAPMAGAQAIALIRALETPAARTPAIAVIGGDPEEARACLDAGANCVMRKPVTVSGVARALAEAMAPPSRSYASAPIRLVHAAGE
jgi:CheY-like chemotaxis protein